MTLRTKPTTLRFYKECLLRVLVHIQQHLDEPIELQTLARTACLSPHHFHHVFTGMLGESVAGHVRRLRLERAAMRLKLSTTPVVQIAFGAGYETHESFTRAFRSAFGISPIQFRKQKGVSVRVETPSAVHYSPKERPTKFRVVKSEKSMNVTINQIKPLRVAFMRHVGHYNKVGKTWDHFLMSLGKDGFIGGSVQFIGITHDDPGVTPQTKLRYDACVTVDEKFRASGEIGVQKIAGGDYAVLTHFGPYESLGRSYTELLGQWLPRSRRCLRPVPCFELYLNSPESTDPEDLVTDIHAPLEPLTI